jgi:hypothetical protein
LSCVRSCHPLLTRCPQSILPLPDPCLACVLVISLLAHAFVIAEPLSSIKRVSPSPGRRVVFVPPAFFAPIHLAVTTSITIAITITASTCFFLQCLISVLSTNPVVSRRPKTSSSSSLRAKRRPWRPRLLHCNEILGTLVSLILHHLCKFNVAMSQSFDVVSGRRTWPLRGKPTYHQQRW